MMVFKKGKGKRKTNTVNQKNKGLKFNSIIINSVFHALIMVTDLNINPQALKPTVRVVTSGCNREEHG